MLGRVLIPRNLQSLLVEKTGYSPVCLIHGPRQCGKTTLAQSVGEPLGYSYFTFDDPDTRVAAQSDPMGFVGELPERAILDEIQLAPELFRVIKLSVDRHRVPGRFILTGSTNMLFVPDLANALTGRMEIIRIHPLSQHEIEPSQSLPFLERLFAGNFQTRRVERLSNNLADRIVAGGYPEALKCPSNQSRYSWYRSYANSLIQRDILDLSKIQSSDTIPRLLTTVANLSGQLFNLATIASQFEMSRNTVRDYLILLERQFLIERLPPWFSNRMKRMVKKPKIHISDTGLACTLLRMEPDSLLKNRDMLGQLLESFVLQELRRQASYSGQPYEFYHYRDRDGFEVDLVIELGAFELAGVEVKASATVAGSDFKGLRKIKTAEDDRFKFGALLYDGEICASFGDGMYAVPIRMLWENSG
ncbi:MAG: ATP-binding protein [Rhodothermaceae bacterium]|nr:ATP-binding protein [Rhodothermaceae bacterium]MXW33891.1 ATP-binding protein [Rhodothermaceae bacterium]MYC04449.1 ATP-binding protein [Rhodothermaceae bacterium]MYE61775.1 ATP-binding protein [Rhodothermaceae bacterium]MYI16196.1 ATP-binding protein [Rhodothermaceae bacterium]